MVDFYNLLGVTENASQQEIKKAYQKKAFQHHPDLNPKDAQRAQQQFREITEAYQVLRDAATRAQYDTLRRGGYTSAGADFADSYHPRSPYSDADFDRAFDQWWKKMGQGFQEYAEKRRQQERSEFERQARAAAWEREKEEAQHNKARSERVRQRTEDARHARHAAILRRFWQTHAGVTWVDAAVAGLVLLSVSGLAYRWRVHLEGEGGGGAQCQVPPRHSNSNHLQEHEQQQQQQQEEEEGKGAEREGTPCPLQPTPFPHPAPDLAATAAAVAATAAGAAGGP